MGLSHRSLLWYAQTLCAGNQSCGPFRVHLSRVECGVLHWLCVQVPVRVCSWWCGGRWDAWHLQFRISLT